MGRTLTRRTGGLAVAVLAVGLVACSAPDPGDDGAIGLATTTEAETSSTTRPVACVAGDMDPRLLAPLVVEDVPGFSQEPDSTGGTGPSDLAKAISDDGQPDADRVLNETGFRAGYQRLWSNNADDRLVIFVYEFCKEDGAQSYAQRGATVFERAGAPIQPVVGPSAGSGFTLVDGDVRGLWLSATSGTVLVQVIAYSRQTDDPDALLQRADDLLAAQLGAIARAGEDAV